MENKVTAIIPVHNRADLLVRLLDTIEHQTVPFAGIIAVDNASTDNAAEVARARGCHVVSMGANTGFARAVNRGWTSAATGLVAILNSDVELDSHWLERLLSHMGDNAFATGLILDASNRNTVDGTWDLVTRAGCVWRAGYGEPAPTGCRPQRIAIAPGTACILRRDILERLNGFDESYDSYLEDIDLGLRCLRAGLSGIYVPDAIAYHHGSATLGRWNSRVVRLISRNQLLLVSKHYDKALFRTCLWPIIAGQVLWGLVALRHGAGFAWVRGKWDAIRAFHLDGEPSCELSNFLISSEHEIRTRTKGPYWRWYFRLAGYRKTGSVNPSGAAH
jgi:GT2 family glycosyltransferase